MLAKATSYADVSGTTIVNEVQNTFNNFGQLQEQYQEHVGAVNTGTTPKVQYGYADGNANTIRPTSMTYPNGRVLEYLYDDTAADKLSRIRTLRWDGVNACRYSYLGLGTFVGTDYLPPQVKLNYAGGSGANPYTGFDRFGRIIDLLWAKYGASGSSSSSSSSGGPGNDLVHLRYGYDRASNRTYRRDEVARSYGKNFDELYEYDGLNQLKKFHRGLLVDGNTVVENPGLQQAWQFDATGNWSNFTTFDPSDVTKTLDQQRLHNRVNEITEIARTVGADWVTPTYDRNGNMTGDETGKVFMYDAWNRLKVVKDSGGTTLKTYSYDASNRRVNEIASGVTTDQYYSAQWQVLEERVAGEVQTQYVWSLTYINALVLRDRASSTSGTLDERLWVMQDANWNVTGLVDGTGAVVERYMYEPFGMVQVYNPDYSTVLGSSLYAWTQGFQGMFYDSVPGLSHQRHRWYSPSLGRWVTTDPLMFVAGDNNFYRMVENGPTSMLDPSGLDTEDDDRAILIAEIERWQKKGWIYPVNLLQHFLNGTGKAHTATGREVEEVKDAINIYLGIIVRKKLEGLNADTIKVGDKVSIPTTDLGFAAFSSESQLGSITIYGSTKKDVPKGQLFINNYLFYTFGGVRFSFNGKVKEVHRIGSGNCNEIIVAAEGDVTLNDDFTFPGGLRNFSRRNRAGNRLEFEHFTAKRFKTNIEYSDRFTATLYRTKSHSVTNE